MCSVDNITTFGQNVFETAAEGASVQNIDMKSEFSCKKDQIAWGENNWVNSIISTSCNLAITYYATK